jgi:hypothetical protein
MKFQTSLPCVLSFGLAASALPQSHSQRHADAATRATIPTIWIAGDSTTAPDGGHNGTEGWGQYLQYSFGTNAKVNNSAYAGRSARSVCHLIPPLLSAIQDEKQSGLIRSIVHARRPFRQNIAGTPTRRLGDNRIRHQRRRHASKWLHQLSRRQRPTALPWCGRRDVYNDVQVSYFVVVSIYGEQCTHAKQQRYRSRLHIPALHQNRSFHLPLSRRSWYCNLRTTSHQRLGVWKLQLQAVEVRLLRHVRDTTRSNTSTSSLLSQLGD